ncbi:MAG: mycothiol synthase, partial [Ilumatobacteraceae bacterium]
MVVDVLRRLNDIQRLAVERLMDVAEQVDGARPLSDHLWLDFVADHSPTYVGLLLPVHPNDADAAKPVDLAGYAQLQQNNGVWSLAVVIGPQHRSDVAPLIKLVERAVTYTAEHHGGTINWWVPTHVGNEFEAAVAAHGFHLARELHQMRRPLPLTQTTDLAVRAFEPGSDEADWLVVNNRAFSTHPEQGGWNIAALAQRQMEPWFDPEGFLLHERDGVLAGFCWTKVHTEIDPPVGEIYAIGVDPAFHGLGLGKALTVAGLEHLAARGLSEAMLYVDAANTTATGMYTRLGFIIDHTDRAFQADVAASEQLPTWSVADVHESFTARSFLDAMERADADATRLTAMFDHLNIRATTARAVSEADGEAADRVIQAYNDALAHLSITGAFVHAAVSTNSYDAHAQGVASELDGVQARLAPLMARLAEWVAALGVDQLTRVSEQVAENTGPLSRLAARAERQMSESEEGLYAELRTTGSSAWQRLHSDVTSQLE